MSFITFIVVSFDDFFEIYDMIVVSQGVKFWLIKVVYAYNKCNLVCNKRFDL